MDAVDVLRGTSTHVKLGIQRPITDKKSGQKHLGYEIITLNRNARGRIGLVLGAEDDEIIVDDVIQDEPAAVYVHLSSRTK